MADANKNWKKQEGSQIWLPTKEGEEIEGTISSINTEGTYGNQYLIKKSDGESILTPSHKVLQNRLLKAKEGQEVKIKYMKEEPPAVKGQNPTKMYDVWLIE